MREVRSVQQEITAPAPAGGSGEAGHLILAVTLAAALVTGLLEIGLGMPGSVWALGLVPVALASWWGGWAWGVAAVALALGVPALAAGGAPLGFALPEGGAVELLLRIGVHGAAVAGTRVLRQRYAGRASDAMVDVSTGLASGRALFAAVGAEMERAQRYARPFTLLYVGIDDLPTVRRRSGGDAAEEMMRRVALMIRASVRGYDLVARLRDREFALLLPETPVEAAEAVLSRMERRIEGSLEDEPLRVSFAIGAITVGGSTEWTAEELHQKTYQLMYAARRGDERVRHERIGATAPSPFPAAPTGRGNH